MEYAEGNPQKTRPGEDFCPGCLKKGMPTASSPRLVSRKEFYGDEPSPPPSPPLPAHFI